MQMVTKNKVGSLSSEHMCLTRQFDSLGGS